RELSFVYCVEDWSSSGAREGFAFATFTLVFVLPGATMAAAYCRIGVRLCGGGAASLNRSEGRAGKQSVTFRIQNITERRKLVAKRFLILTTVFAVCWVPYNIATLLLDFQVLLFRTPVEAPPLTPLSYACPSAERLILHII
ncbi:g_PROTEIN_RECEP_F1_2 domain-containing protein, partial [Caerostris extrusa]